MRLRILMIPLAILLFTPVAKATCFECDQHTAWDCFMAQGTKGGCDGIEGSGCMTWGRCDDDGGGGGDCFACVPLPPLVRATPTSTVPMTADLIVTSVTVHPARARKAATPAHTSA